MDFLLSVELCEWRLSYAKVTFEFPPNLFIICEDINAQKFLFYALCMLFALPYFPTVFQSFTNIFISFIHSLHSRVHYSYSTDTRKLWIWKSWIWLRRCSNKFCQLKTCNFIEWVHAMDNILYCSPSPLPSPALQASLEKLKSETNLFPKY